MSITLPPCPLCATPAKLFEHAHAGLWLRCPSCAGIFRDPKEYLSPAAEKNFYYSHENNVFDPGYRRFVEPITRLIELRFNTLQKGLDFGAGTGPVITQVLKEQGYSMETWDPFFDNRPEVLKKSYDFIACCEVMEHFHHPLQEFKTMYNLLRPMGALICKTHLYTPEVEFAKWYYRKDPTHVFIYQHATLEFIRLHCGFSSLQVQDRLIVFNK
jgi:hypothetical protein